MLTDKVPLADKLNELEERVKKLEKQVEFLKANTIPVIRHRLSDDAIRKSFDELEKETDSAMDKMWAAIDRFCKRIGIGW